MKLTATCRLVSDKSGVRLQFSYDLARLWNWFLLKETGMIMHTAKRCAKIGLYRPNSYHKSKPNQKVLKKLVGKKYRVSFDVSKIQYLYAKRGYWVHFVQVTDPVVMDLLKQLGIDGNFDDWNKPHMSISNGKYFKRK